MLDHLSIQCADIPRSAAFYDTVLAPLGYTRITVRGVVRDPDGNNVEAVCHLPQ